MWASFSLHFSHLWNQEAVTSVPLRPSIHPSPNVSVHRQWGHQMTLHQHFRPGRLSTHHKRHYCWTSCQLQKRLALLKNNVAVRSPRISQSPQREGGALQRLAALCSVQLGWGCYLSSAGSSNLSFSKKSKVPDISRSGRVSFRCGH